ncbi:glycosyltransferase [Streptomyces sp. ODS05-4]|uniref:glycosyltransferase n=1 Tax=Streptomyces sp. ODS05-4 TaxID=2944939 RepID=UPI00210C7660|nr:glycosyltransferase [Streptomyces sp. ODS05-4]
MPKPPPPQRLVVLAGADTALSSRTGRLAVAAARDGWDVTVLSPGAGGEREEESLGAVTVVRVPVGASMRELTARRARGHRLRRGMTQLGLTGPGDLRRFKAGHRSWIRRASVRAAERGTAAQIGAKAWIRLRQSAYRARLRVYDWERRRDLKASAPAGGWGADWPELLDLDLAVGAELERLEPDVVQVCDLSLVPAAGIAVTRLRTAGMRTRWLYDITAPTATTAYTPARRHRAYQSVERVFLAGADALTAPTERLAATAGEGRAPLVVREAAPAPAPADGRRGPAVRDLCGLHGAGPLLVYAGDPDEHQLHTAVAALALLPGHHLALMSEQPVPEGLRARAEEEGVADRLHTPPRDLSARYLASADAALAGCGCAVEDEPARDLLSAALGQAGLPVVDACGHEPADLAKLVAEAVEAARPDSAAERAEHTWEHRVAPVLALYRELAGGGPATGRPELGWDGEVRSAPVAETRPPRPLPTWTPVTERTPVRLGLGPANYAGQMAAFAHAVCRTRPDVSAQVFMVTEPGTFNYPADVYLEGRKLGRLTVMLEQSERVFRTYTHLLADAFLPVLGRLNGNHLEGDVPALLRTSIKVGLVAHGSEIRHPGRHLERVAYSLFRDAPEGMVEKLTERAERNRALAERTGLPSFVTTPDLLDDLPSARWAPLVVDVDALACDRPVMERRRPVVLHAPSKRWTKGTDRVLPVLEELDARGVIEFRLAEGVDWTRMREMIQDADVVVDQFSIGAYGTFACEGMAAGKPVVACLSPTVEKALGEGHPVVNAGPGTLREALESLLDDRHAAALLGERSARFAREHHDGTRTAEVLSDFLS